MAHINAAVAQRHTNAIEVRLHATPYVDGPSQGGLEKLQNLRVLLMSNNKIAGWNEIDKLGALANLEDLLLVGNPLYNEFKDNNSLSEYRVEVRGKPRRVGMV